MRRRRDANGRTLDRSIRLTRPIPVLEPFAPLQRLRSRGGEPKTQEQEIQRAPRPQLAGGGDDVFPQNHEPAQALESGGEENLFADKESFVIAACSQVGVPGAKQETPGRQANQWE